MRCCPLVALTIFLLTVHLTTSEKWLDDFVSTYEITDQTAASNHRLKRSISDGILHEIRAFNRSFLLQLQPDLSSSSFSSDHVLEFGENQEKSVDFSRFLVVGNVLGDEENSLVHGSLINGRFEGEILLNGIRYVVENSEKFTGKQLPKLSSVVYRDVDVSFDSPKRKRRSADGQQHLSTCGWSHDDIKAGLKQQETSSATRVLPRSKREAATLSGDPLTVPKICGVFMQVDHLLYSKFLDEANYQKDAAATNILTYLDYVVKTANSIYLSTNFTSQDGTAGPYRNLQMAVLRTKIYTTESQFASAFQIKPFENIKNLDPTTFLNVASRNNHDMYCVSFVFTLRDFANGVLGLAWIHYPDTSQRGGVCDRYGPTRYGFQSLNSGIITQLNYGQVVSRLVSATTFAHEMGHAFGSHHDNTPAEGQLDDPRCYPGGTNGNYIMYSSANYGDKSNNHKFSFCSRDMIARNLKHIINNPSSLDCFRSSVQFCGNSIVDPGEECDCGFYDSCGEDQKCCGPADHPDPQKRCKLLQRGRVSSKGMPITPCSLSNGPCCNVDTCSIRTKRSKFECRQSGECYHSAFCDGNKPTCPPSSHEPDGKLCFNFTKVCRSGSCSASSCETIVDATTYQPFSGCQPVRPADKSRYNRSELCYLSCRSPSTGKCHNSAHLDSDSKFDASFRAFLNSVNQGNPIQLVRGSPCDNDRGFCDAFQKCRISNSDSPLNLLRDVFLSDSTWSVIRKWIETHWYVVVIAGVVILAVMAVFIKFCSFHTPTDHPIAGSRFHGRGSSRASFRPVLLDSGPPQGRGRGRKFGPKTPVNGGPYSVSTVQQPQTRLQANGGLVALNQNGRIRPTSTPNGNVARRPPSVAMATRPITTINDRITTAETRAL